MFKKVSLIALSWLAILAIPSQSLAETVIERVARTGTLTVGARVDLVPYSYVNDKEELTGYSMDLIELIREQLEKDLGKKVKLNIVVDDEIGDRIQSVINGEIDIVCDTIFTWQRDKFVDFSLAYTVSGIKLLVKKESNLSSPESFKGKRIGIVKNSLRQEAIKVIESQVTIVNLNSLEEGLKAVADGKIDGFAFDGTILEGMRQTLANPDAYKVVPNESYFRHGIACMVPENDSTFLNLVNYTIAKMMDGYLTGDSRYVEMINRYFGKDGIVTIQPDVIRNFFEMMIITREQIPPKEISAE
ncbi:extracellular substrate binding-like orphan protein GrrP [Crocosphaera sp. UHCC 0190]|uniref:extracellular substrate binding-like orphan protein GrrP n=1 Tax=Crocosphaera sp. UHCC 0190 TaxID=3110246 RepID=UPI002B1F7F8F|nr:extracellular substrate binding-like orphan protein GrrP [Crocosphaera sp. UHCC 0190]MEA5510156.1 extracellular substrate binding-like orphan protein GrrP [Crocosphaera sp. UHCC 0190]